MTHSAEENGVSQRNLLLGVPFTQHEQGSGQEDRSEKDQANSSAFFLKCSRIGTLETYSTNPRKNLATRTSVKLRQTPVTTDCARCETDQPSALRVRVTRARRFKQPLTIIPQINMAAAIYHEG
jgi:hypothetical protein